MALSQRFGNHLRGNLVGYVALFVALSGTALALPGKGSVKSNDIARGAVKGKALADGAVGKVKIRPGAVGSAAIDDGSVVAADLADSAVIGPKIADDAVGRAKIEAGSINGGKLANGSVNSAKVNDGSLQAEDFAPGQLSDGFAFTNESSSFTLPRAGRLFVTANFVSVCTSGTCTYTVQVNGGALPGATIMRSSANAGEQLTLTGLTVPLQPGTYTISIGETGPGADEEQVTLAGILLQ
jgi:hypothetical protein